MVRPCNAQRNTIKLKSYMSEPTGLTEHVKFHDSTIRRRLNKYGLFDRVARRKPPLSKKNMEVRLRITKLPAG